MFLNSFILIFAAEMGDKTQLLLTSIAVKHKLSRFIAATAAAIVVFNATALTIGITVGKMIPLAALKLGSGAAFMCFALFYLIAEENKKPKNNSKTSFIIIFLLFFIAELGDKTQLAVMALSSGCDFSGGITVFLASSFGILAADLIGIFAGYSLRKKLPKGALSTACFGFFSAFGIITMVKAVSELTTLSRFHLWCASAAVAAAFSITGYILCSRKAKKIHVNSDKNKPLSLVRH